MVHVNFHFTRQMLSAGTILRKDPITQKLKRVPKNFDRSDVFYTENGRLIDDKQRGPPRQ
jgi:hypothetical protein